MVSIVKSRALKTSAIVHPKIIIYAHKSLSAGLRELASMPILSFSCLFLCYFFFPCKYYKLYNMYGLFVSYLNIKSKILGGLHSVSVWWVWWSGKPNDSFLLKTLFIFANFFHILLIFPFPLMHKRTAFEKKK